MVHDFYRELVSHHAGILQERVRTLEDVVVRSTETDAARPNQRMAWQPGGCRKLSNVQPTRLRTDESFDEHGELPEIGAMRV